MYTELNMCCRVKDDPVAVSILMYLAHDRAHPPTELPDHPLFKCERWHQLLTCSSYYFVPRSVAIFEYDDVGKSWCLVSHAGLKNYDGEIGKFIDWISPYVDDRDTMIGYSRYEEDRDPVIYYSPS